MAGSRERLEIDSGSPWEAMAGYRRAIAEGDWVFVSGTVGVDAATGIFPEGAERQTHKALDIIEKALAEAGCGWPEVVRVRVYAADRADIGTISAVLKSRFNGARPTNTTVCCALVAEEARVELEMTAKRKG